MNRERTIGIGAMVTASFLGGGLVNFVLSSTGPVNAQARPGIVTTEQVNLVDASGRLRGILSARDEQGMTSLALLDEAGRRRAVLAAGTDGAPSLALYDQDAALRVHAAIQAGAPVLVVNGDNGRRAILGALTGSPTLSFVDGQLNRAQLGFSARGLPNLEMAGPNGQLQASLMVDRDGQPLLTLRDQTGHSRATLGVVADTTVMNLTDGASPRVVLGVAPDGNGTLSFLDADGAVTRAVP